MAFINCFVLVLLGFHVVLIATPCQASTLQPRADDPNALEALVMRQSQMIDQLQAELTSLKARVAEQESKVAFNVRLIANTHITDDHILVFDLVDLNQGGGYDKVTGLFTAPVSGLYVFNVKVTHTPPGDMHIVVRKDGRVPLAEADARGEDLDRSAATVAVQLAKGNKIWVERQLDSTATELQSDFRTSFSGFLLRPDQP